MQQNERFVRDLAWAVNSPMLMDLTREASGDARLLNPDDVDPEHLSGQLTADRTQRVGRYFEQLIVYWIRFIRRCEVVAQGLPIRDGKRTVGEIDLLFRDEHGRLTHWEVACKFYLQVRGEGDARMDYVGPNANDTLGKKATRLVEHQLPLGTRYFPEIDVQAAFVKGRIFYHWQHAREVSLADEWSSCDVVPGDLVAGCLAPGHLGGSWMWARETRELFCDAGRRYRILRKPFWLADEFASVTDDGVMTAEEVARVLDGHFTERGTPVLLSVFPECTTPVRECERWFIVPDDWPAR